MAAEWDNLITDARGMPVDISFDDSQERGQKKVGVSKKKGLSPASSEQSLISEEKEEYEVTEYIMEYTDIFEPSTQRLDFIDVQEGDAISDVGDEIVAHSTARSTYENTPSEIRGEDAGACKDYANMGTWEKDEDSRLDNGITEKHGERSDARLEDKETRALNVKGSSVKTEEKRQERDESDERAERNGLSEDTNEFEGGLGAKEEQSVREEKETRIVDEDRPSEGEEEGEHDNIEEEQNEIKEEEYDDEEEKTEVDKLLENDYIVSEETKTVKIDKRRRKEYKSQKVSAGTQAEEVPLLNASLSSSPEPPADSPRTKKAFTPKAYPGKVVKSVAIGTDDDDFGNAGLSRGTRNATRDVELDVDRPKGMQAKERTGKVRTRQNVKTSTPVSKHRQRANGDGGRSPHSPKTDRHRISEHTNHTSDANFFRSRLPQTSKRHPKRHVWLCRDSEIHRLIAEKASILRRYKDEGITGHRRSKGFPNYSEVDVLGLPSVGFAGRTKDDSYRRSLPYARHPSSSQGYRSYTGSSSEDEDERTNRVGTKGAKSAGTFAVGLAARRDNVKSKQQQQQKQQQLLQHQSDDDEDGCELCAAEAREREKHEKKLKELENAAKAGPHHPRNLMLGIVYSAKFLGSTHLMSLPTPNKAVRLQQAQEAIGRIKVPEGEEQPSSDVDLFISTERIKVVSSDKKQTLIDHHLKTISFIADIGNIIVVMARLSTEKEPKEWSGQMPDFNPKNQEEKTAKVVCHVLETSEAQTVAKTVGQAFSIAYHEFLKVNQLNLSEIEDMEYNGILEQQKILGEELSLLADESKAKEVVIHKKYGESLSMMIVESGWGSMIPTVVIAHLDNKGPAAKSGQLNVGNQILAVNGQSLVGLPLLECQNVIRAMKYEERVAFKVVFCPPTVEICINRPDTKYQLGFSVQNGMICSLMRGGIAERGGVRVGHKIIEMNGESVVAASHHHIVEILQTTIGELRMKTMPITLYKLLVGLEIPQYL